MKKNISQTVIMLFVICALSTKMTAQSKIEFSNPLNKNLSSVKKDTIAHEKNLLYMPTRDGNHQVRNLFYNPQKDGKVNVVLLADGNDASSVGLASEKMHFEALHSVIKLKQVEHSKKKKPVK
jgi:hypothetical protein